MKYIILIAQITEIKTFGTEKKATFHSPYSQSFENTCLFLMIEWFLSRSSQTEV